MKIVPTALAGDGLLSGDKPIDRVTLTKDLFESGAASPVEDLSPEDRRIETRLSFLLNLPLIGWRGEMRSIFKYRPLDVSPRGIRLYIDVDGAGAVQQREQVDLCLPFLLNAEFLNIGTVRWADPVGQDFLCGVTLSHRPHFQYPIAFDFSSGLPVQSGTGMERPDRIDAFLKRALDDAVLTKRAVTLYFGHLTPLLARLPGHLKLNDFPLVGDRIARNVKALQELATSIPTLESIESRQEFLGRFRQAILPEINEFSLRSLDQFPEVAPHLRSIRQAERKLALHYNAAVLLIEGFANPDLPIGESIPESG